MLSVGEATVERLEHHQLRTAKHVKEYTTHKTREQKAKVTTNRSGRFRIYIPKTYLCVDAIPTLLCLHSLV